MADKARYPQIPATVWWGVRSILQKSPKATVDERMLGVSLGVQEAAARQYISELKSVGILDDDGKATPLANKWRLDDSYAEAAEEIVTRAYPENLVHLTSPNEGDRQKVITWFEREGLGRGAAGNKAATYFLLGSPTPNEAPGKSGGKTRSAPQKQERNAAPSTNAKGPLASKSSVQNQKRGAEPLSGNIPLNVNVQIHISADAGVEQINAIFSAMRRYLSDDSAA